MLPLSAVERPGMPIFREGCTVSFGFTVTSEEPHEQRVAGLSVRNQRHFIPIRLRVRNGLAAFYNEKVDPTAPGVGNVIYLRRAAHHSIDHEARSNNAVDKGAVLNAVLASSAFPVVFGRRTLEFCRPSKSSSSPSHLALPRYWLREKTSSRRDASRTYTSTQTYGAVSIDSPRHQEKPQ
jgi:hypothetical protein